MKKTEINKIKKDLLKEFNVEWHPIKISYRDDKQEQAGEFLSCVLDLQAQNKKLENSNYYYNNTLEFIHFTSLESLNSILNEGQIRLYNINHSTDPREFKLAAKYIGLRKKLWEEATRNIYILSMCEKVLKQKSHEKHLLWRLYGKDGNGVCLVIKIKNSPKNWYDYHLSKIYYGNNCAEKISLRKIKKLNDQYKNGIYIDGAKLTCFYKSYLYKYEQEVRLLFDNRKYRTINHPISKYQNQIMYPNVIRDKINSVKKINYIVLPLANYFSNNNNFEIPSFDGNKYYMPKIELQEIIVGYRIKGKKFKTVKENIETILQKNNINIVDITNSKFSRYY